MSDGHSVCRAAHAGIVRLLEKHDPIEGAVQSQARADPARPSRDGEGIAVLIHQVILPKCAA